MVKMSEPIEKLETMVGALLAVEPLPTPERIRELIETLRRTPMCSEVSPAEAEQLAMDLEERHGVTMRIGSLLTGEQYEPWLDSARASITPYYWGRYRKLLAEQGLSGQVIATLDTVSDRILGLLENPAKESPWDRRGMVVGHVQSGKTANYAALICKAADAGYRLVVVIAGVHNNLRNQTQRRIDEAVIGHDSSRLGSSGPQHFIGVGRYDATRRPVTFTTSVKDFNKATATGIGVPLRNLTEPAVFVVKKNSNTLQNLLEWLKEHSARVGMDTVDAPMLLIDDEADNASINTKHGTAEVTRINGQLRDLLRLFDRSCYVGYTATPFANIFIDPDSTDEMLGADLFPKDFIISLDPPSNYFGAVKVFILDQDKIVRTIDDSEEFLPLRHTIDIAISGLPNSLQTALRTFIIASTIRLARGQVNEHSSMLVNASRFTDVQRQLRNEIHEELEGIKASIRVNSALPMRSALKDPELAALHAVWREEYEGSTEFTWESLQLLLHEAASKMTVVEVNSRSAGTLNYADNEKSGLSVVAIGGFSLSRGLTLEGLTVSYFLRNSMMYDTLMQMGRWFGYRPGYEDLCRIWMPDDAAGWYAHITESIEELREELRVMEAASATPAQFGLKVRSHPDTLVVTARNKMGSGEVFRLAIGLANRFVETTLLKSDPDSLAANRSAVKRLASRLQEAGVPVSRAARVPGGWLLRGVPMQPVQDFVSEFQNHPGSLLTDPVPLQRYIAQRRDTELGLWDILFTSTDRAETPGLKDRSIGLEINCQRRTAGPSDAPSTLRIGTRQRVASRGVEKTGLTDEQRAEAERLYRGSLGEADLQKAVNYPDHAYRRLRDRPLLIVHLLAIAEKSGDLRYGDPVVAYSISFPITGMEETRVEYVVNTTWLREYYRQDLEEDEMAGDDE